MANSLMALVNELKKYDAITRMFWSEAVSCNLPAITEYADEWAETVEDIADGIILCLEEKVETTIALPCGRPDLLGPRIVDRFFPICDLDSLLCALEVLRGCIRNIFVSFTQHDRDYRKENAAFFGLLNRSVTKTWNHRQHMQLHRRLREANLFILQEKRILY